MKVKLTIKKEKLIKKLWNPCRALCNLDFATDMVSDKTLDIGNMFFGEDVLIPFNVGEIREKRNYVNNFKDALISDDIFSMYIEAIRKIVTRANKKGIDRELSTTSLHVSRARRFIHDCDALMEIKLSGENYSPITSKNVLQIVRAANFIDSIYTHLREEAANTDVVPEKKNDISKVPFEAVSSSVSEERI